MRSKNSTMAHFRRLCESEAGHWREVEYALVEFLRDGRPPGESYWDNIEDAWLIAGESVAKWLIDTADKRLISDWWDISHIKGSPVCLKNGWYWAAKARWINMEYKKICNRCDALRHAVAIDIKQEEERRVEREIVAKRSIQLVHSQQKRRLSQLESLIGVTS